MAQDAYHMGRRVGSNVDILFDTHPTEKMKYLIVTNTATGESVRLEFSEDKTEATEEPTSDLKKLCQEMLDESAAREVILAPEDVEIRELCERVGYGAVMDSAARQWRRKDPYGAFVVGPCIGTLESELIKEAINESINNPSK